MPNLLGGLGGGGLGGLVGGGIGGLLVGGFKAIVHALFGGVAKFITADLIGWLTAIPNFEQGHVLTLEQNVAAICGGVLGAVATYSVIRYWLAGFAGGGDSGFAALEGLMRSVGAALFIATWASWIFPNAIHLVNLLTSSLLGLGSTTASVTKLLEAGFVGTLGAGVTSSALGLFLGIAIAVAASLLFLGLLLLKIVLSVSTILLFVGMPFAALLWPIAPWIGRLVGRAFMVCLAVPVLWALCFAAAAAVGVDALTASAPGALNKVLEPLVAIALLYMMVRLPMHLSRIAMLGGMAVGGGFVSRAASYAAGSQMRETARQHVPEGLGGRPAEKPQPESPLGRRLRTAATAAGMAATGSTAAGAAAVAGRTSGGAGATPAWAAGAVSSPAGGAKAKAAGAASGIRSQAYTPPPIAQARASGETLQTGFRDGPFHEDRFHDEMEQAEGRACTNPITVGEARAALADLPGETQKSVGQLASKYGEKDGEEKARRILADQATRDAWWPEERDALRALAAATPEVRAQAVQEAGQDDRITNGPAAGLDTAATGGSAAGPARAGNGSVGGGDEPVGGPAALQRDRPDPGLGGGDETSERRAEPGVFRDVPEGGVTAPPGRSGVPPLPRQPDSTNLRPPREPHDPGQGS
jgi:hypothetical protein